MGIQKPEYSDVRGFIPTTEQRPFQPLFVTPDDFLMVAMRNSLAAGNFTLSGRLWLPNGQVNEFSQPLVPNSARALALFSMKLHYGWLDQVVVTANQVTRRGMALASLQLVRPPVPGFTTKWLLAQDYVTTINAVAWPPGRIMEGVESTGLLYSVSVANPAAGADWNTTVPNFARWRLRGVRATLVTAVAVATRAPKLIVTAAVGAPAIFHPPAATQAASLTVNYTGLALGAPITTVAAENQWLLEPDPQVESFPVANLGVVAVVTDNLQAADQWSGISLLVEEWLED